MQWWQRPGGGASPGRGASSTNALNYCQEGSRRSARVFRLRPADRHQLYGSQSNCVNQNNGQCANSACTGGKTFDQSAADQCLAAYPAASCTGMGWIFTAVCSQVCK